MTAVKVSPKFQVVIPKELRTRLKLKPGQTLYVYEHNGRLIYDLPRPISEIFGIAAGIKWKDDYRDRRDRF